MCRPKEPIAPADFMPSQFGKAKQQPTQKRVRMTKAVKKQVTESFRSGFAALRQRR